VACSPESVSVGNKCRGSYEVLHPKGKQLGWSTKSQKERFPGYNDWDVKMLTWTHLLLRVGKGYYLFKGGSNIS
jgi:hypothetical protein